MRMLTAIVVTVVMIAGTVMLAHSADLITHSFKITGTSTPGYCPSKPANAHCGSLRYAFDVPGTYEFGVPSLHPCEGKHIPTIDQFTTFVVTKNTANSFEFVMGDTLDGRTQVYCVTVPVKQAQ